MNNKPKRTRCTFNDAMIEQCKQFATQSLPTSSDQYARRNQDASKVYRQIIQLTNGKLGEELAYACYSSYYPDLTRPDYEIYQASSKSWEPDLTSVSSGVRLAVKTKDAIDANQWGMSIIVEKTDRKLMGPNLDGKNLDPNQFVLMTIIDAPHKKGEVVACVKLQWLHDNNLFSKPDRDYLSTKLTVRLENMQKVISDPGELWQLPIPANQ